MSHHIYKHIQITGTSGVSIDDAINAAVARAHKTVRNLRWFEILETRGAIESGKVEEWQVTIKIGFTLDE